MTADSAVLIDALRSGARDLTEHGDTDHLQLVVARELSDLGHRRAEARLRERLDESEQRSRDLVDTSGKTVAFVPEGNSVALDTDTGLPNRTALIGELNSRLAESVSGRKSFALIYRNAISEVAAQRSKGRKANFFVKVAEQTLQEEELLIWIRGYLREFQARGSWLTLQILKGHARRNAAVFNRLNQGLRKLKCRVALNRFGEGPDPALLLRSLRLDLVKFPPYLANGLADDRRKQRQLQELTKLCRDAGAKSVVTGVEDARSLTVLWTAGIDYVQGNLLQKPGASIGKVG